MYEVLKWVEVTHLLLQQLKNASDASSSSFSQITFHELDSAMTF
jgi:hypothetical protein